jgi:N-glycosylase/DNA lyase
MYPRLPSQKETAIKELSGLYVQTRDAIVERLREFRSIWRGGSEEDIFAELIFCILTPQAKARSCSAIVENLLREDLLLKGDEIQLSRKLHRSRFKYKKARYIVEAREQFVSNGQIRIKPRIDRFREVHCLREWLVQNVKGMGYKEASHFLRNIGLGEELAILDRHILRSLKWLGVLERIPTHLTKSRYFEVERMMERFAEEIDVPIGHLDLLLWYKQTYQIFK